MTTDLIHPLHALWRPQTLIAWLFAGEGLAAVITLSADTADSLVYFGVVSMFVQWIIFLTIALLYTFRSKLQSLPLPQLAYVTFFTFLAVTWFVGGAAWLTLQDVWRDTGSNWLSLFQRLTGTAVIVGLLGLLAFTNHWQARNQALRAKQAELSALQARVHPHFLFNTLNTATALLHERPDEAERLLLDLSDLFRAALSGPQDISLGEEIALAKRYTEIELLRFGDRLRIIWDLPPALPDIKVPALAIQTLLENAIKHGIEPSPTGGDIRVLVEEENHEILIRIENTVQKEHGTHRGHHVGLLSSIARVEALTDGRGRVTTEQTGGKYIATVILPKS